MLSVIPMDMKVPLLLMPIKQARAAARPFYGVASRLAAGNKFLEKDLYKIDSGLSATSYVGISLLNAAIYSVLVGALAYSIISKIGFKNGPVISLALALLAFFGILVFCLAYPRWMLHQKVAQIDRDLLFAARHLRIQTSAGVPLFEALASASRGYGSVSDEFEDIITSVQGGTSLSEALENSATKNPSYYYNRILWQMSNAVKAGTDIGPVLSDIVEFLADEQRIKMRNYGAQLNSLAIMYLMGCVVVPTTSLIFLMVISSFVSFPITDTVLFGILAALIFVQYMFIGLIESRRPAVAI